MKSLHIDVSIQNVFRDCKGHWAKFALSNSHSISSGLQCIVLLRSTEKSSESAGGSKDVSASMNEGQTEKYETRAYVLAFHIKQPHKMAFTNFNNGSRRFLAYLSKKRRDRLSIKVDFRSK